MLVDLRQFTLTGAHADVYPTQRRIVNFCIRLHERRSRDSTMSSSCGRTWQTVWLGRFDGDAVDRHSTAGKCQAVVRHSPTNHHHLGADESTAGGLRSGRRCHLADLFRQRRMKHGLWRTYEIIVSRSYVNCGNCTSIYPINIRWIWWSATYRTTLLLAPCAWRSMMTHIMNQHYEHPQRHAVARAGNAGSPSADYVGRIKATSIDGDGWKAVEWPAITEKGRKDIYQRPRRKTLHPVAGRTRPVLGIQPGKVFNVFSIGWCKRGQSWSVTEDEYGWLRLSA